MMYARVFASSGVSGGLGPNSNCFLTWAMARSPLKAVATGAGLGLGEVSEMPTRVSVAGRSFRGQPPSNGRMLKSATTASRLCCQLKLRFMLLMMCFDLLLCFGVLFGRAGASDNRIKRAGSDRQWFLKCSVERFRHGDSFELQQRCNLLV